MVIEPTGHFIVFGPTGSGKTQYTKHLLDQLKPEKIYVFAGEPSQWMNNNNQKKYLVQTDPFQTACENIISYGSDKMAKKRAEGSSVDPFLVVVFDDYNDEINTAHDENYKKFYTQGRHMGIRVINLAHYTRAIGPVARANAKYVAVMCTTPEDEIKSIADIWYNKNHIALNRVAKTACDKNPYSVVLFNRTTKVVDVVVAPNNVISHTVDVPLTNNHSLNMDPSMMGYNMVGGPTLFLGNKSAHNMVDTSTNNFNIDHNVRIEQKIQSNQINMDLKFQNVKTTNTINLYQDMHDVHDLAHKSWNTPEEIQKIVYCLNRSLRPNPPFTIHDYQEGLPEFERVFFDNNNYSVSNNKTDKIISKAGNMLLATNNPLLLVSEALSLFNIAGR